MPTFGTAGGFARSVVQTRARRLALVGFGIWLAAAIALHLLPLTSWWMSLPVFALAVWTDREDTMQLLMPWLKGARGEEAVGRLLSELEPEGYRILHDIDTGHGNLDHVVVGPTGVWAIETKAWTGRVYAGPGGTFMRSGTDERGTLKQALGEAFEVKKRIAHTGLTPWVNALVVLTATELERGPMKFGQVRVIESKDLLPTIRSNPERMSPDDVRLAARAVMLGAGVRGYRVTSWDDATPPQA
ncbi:MAG TPA: nuclease-related domain-containing protein [Actinomycetota bacterium]|nr:nuclease-related domain-containing protein [Actinomycetota bacterium]